VIRTLYGISEKYKIVDDLWMMKTGCSKHTFCKKYWKKIKVKSILLYV